MLAMGRGNPPHLERRVMQLKIRAFDDLNQPLKFHLPSGVDNYLMIRCIAVKKFAPELKGGYALIGQWVKPIVSNDQVCASITHLDTTMIIYVEFSTQRLVMVVIPEKAYSSSTVISGGLDFFDYHLEIDQIECRVLTFFTGASFSDAELLRWSALCNLTKSEVRSRCSNSLYRAGFYLLENNYVPRYDLPNGMTVENYIAEKTNDKETLMRIANQKDGKIPVDYTENLLSPYITRDTDSIPDVRKLGFEWTGAIGGIVFVTSNDKNKPGMRGNSMFFADVLAKEIAKKKMTDPENWQKFFEEQAAQLEGIARIYRVIADIARTNQEFEKLKKK